MNHPDQSTPDQPAPTKPWRRVIRVLIYEGTDEWLSMCVGSKREVKGTYKTKNGVIREAIIGDPFEQVRVEEEKP